MVSLLMANGHPEARHYPVPMLWTETRLVRIRLNRRMANEAVLFQMAVSSILSEKAGKAFEKRIEKLLEK